MKRWAAILCAVSMAASAAEVLFTDGPQEYQGRRYYWLAEWKLDVTLPADVAPGDRFEVLFGSKGSGERTLYYAYGDRSGSMAEVRPEAYEWIEIPLGELKAGEHVVLYGKGQPNVAFLAGVRVSGESSEPLKVEIFRTAQISPDTRELMRWADLPGFEMSEDARRLWNPAPEAPDWDRVERSARYAGIALDKVQRWLHEECMAVHDKDSALFRPTGAEWNYRDTAADCYPFYVWAAWFTDMALLETVMLDTLEAEQRLCNQLDRLPVNYDMDQKTKVEIDFDAMIFGASEYAKDGLVPIVEITGRDYPWFERMRGIVDDIFMHAKYETPYGNIPSTNIEVNGELLQILPRLYSMTGEQKYLDWAHRLADSYLLPGKFVPGKLSDHGCEIIGGLGLLFAVDRKAAPEKMNTYRPHMEYMFDEILRRGTNSDGVIIAELADSPGPHDGVLMRDGWGYDFVGFLDYDMALGTKRYEDAIQKPLTNLLKPRYKKFNWDHDSRDNVADSVEGGLYLLYRYPTPEGYLWADREIATFLVDHTEPDRLWGVHKLEANTVRTVLIHTMLHTRNTIARPWAQGLRLGAAPVGKDGVCVYMECDEAYTGRLYFDVPRHRITMGFEEDWPRMNAVPEWFTVEPDDAHQYTVEEIDGDTRVVSGRLLSEGLPIELEPGAPLRLIIKPQS
ncbi:MAG: hypothetical protein KJ060_17720 [Candidatus Hydrogenedentes bacterium]|nr:hypothetical protein [Candidatus Hydrogenedentota bacterium]